MRNRINAVMKATYLVAMMLVVFIVLAHTFLHLMFDELIIFSLIGAIIIGYGLDFLLRKFTSSYLVIFTILAIFVLWIPIVFLAKENRMFFHTQETIQNPMFVDPNLKYLSTKNKIESPFNHNLVVFYDDHVSGKAYLENKEPIPAFGEDFYVYLNVEMNKKKNRILIDTEEGRPHHLALFYADSYLYLKNNRKIHVFDLNNQLPTDHYVLDETTYEDYVAAFVFDNQFYLSSNHEILKFSPNGTTQKVYETNGMIVDAFTYEQRKILVTVDETTDRFSVFEVHEDFSVKQNILDDLHVRPMAYHLNNHLYVMADGVLKRYDTSLNMIDQTDFQLETLVNNWNQVWAYGNIRAGNQIENILIQPWKDYWIFSRVYTFTESPNKIIASSYVVDQSMHVVYEYAGYGFDHLNQRFTGGTLFVVDNDLILDVSNRLYRMTDVKEGMNAFSFPVIPTHRNVYFYIAIYAIFILPIIYGRKKYEIFR